MAKAIFLDKDGTLIPDIPYNVNPDLITLMPDVIVGLKHFSAMGYLLIIISNQAGVAKGFFKEDALMGVAAKMRELFNHYDLFLTGLYYCPNHPDGVVEEYSIACNLRKPEPGMLFQAANDHQIDLTRSWMIGDILNDVEAGNRAGCKTVLIDNGNETEWIAGTHRTPTLICRNINQAAEQILTEQFA